MVLFLKNTEFGKEEQKTTNFINVVKLSPFFLGTLEGIVSILIFLFSSISYQLSLILLKYGCINL